MLRRAFVQSARSAATRRFLDGPEQPRGRRAPGRRSRPGRGCRAWLALLALALPAVAAAGGHLGSVERSRLLASGRLDARVADALDREGRARVVIAFAVPGRSTEQAFRGADERAALDEARAALERITGAGLSVVRRYESIAAVAGQISPAAAFTLAERPEVRHVDLDTPGEAALAEAVPLVRLDLLRASGWTGAGTTVAVVDSGIDAAHPDLADDLVEEQCFCSLTSLSVLAPCCPDGSATQSGPGSAADDLGHGTHVAGIVSSAGAVAPPGGAPDAKIVAIKVLSWANFGLPSDWLAALDWLVVHRPDVDAVNLSLGVTLEYGDCDAGAVPMATRAAVAGLRANGALVFAASHNQGFDEGIAFPACLSNVLSVGASYDDALGPQSFTVDPGTGATCTDPTTAPGQIACFTNSGPNLDLVAPGANLAAPYPGGGTAVLRGTSMATPLGAACALALREAVPDASAEEIEEALLASPWRVRDPKNGLEFPHLDCEASRAWLSLCPAEPRQGCRSAGRSALSLRRGGDGARDRLSWRWQRGAATALTELADPTVDASYGLCLYAGAPPVLVGRGAVGPGSPRWRLTGTGGFRYDDPLGASGGISRMRLRSGGPGRARIVVQGRGSALPDPTLPSPLPVVVQLWNERSEVCWSTSFEAGDVKKNEPSSLRASRR